MTGPEYDPATLDNTVEWVEDDGWKSLPAVVSCSVCGAVVEVDKRDLHTKWHERQKLGVPARRRSRDGSRWKS